MREGREGWVHGDFLGKFTGTAVTSAPLNVRELPSIQAPILAVIPQGTRVDVVGAGSGQFQHVFTNLVGLPAYASGVYLRDPKVDP